MRDFLETVWILFLIFVVIPLPILVLILLLAFLIPLNGWFGLLGILFIPALALTIKINEKIVG